MQLFFLGYDRKYFLSINPQIKAVSTGVWKCHARFVQAVLFHTGHKRNLYFTCPGTSINTYPMTSIKKLNMGLTFNRLNKLTSNIVIQ